MGQSLFVPYADNFSLLEMVFQELDTLFHHEELTAEQKREESAGPKYQPALGEVEKFPACDSSTRSHIFCRASAGVVWQLIGIKQHSAFMRRACICVTLREKSTTSPITMVSSTLISDCKT